ncbi:MAG: type polyketide synthase [Sphingomonas bacterium]|nr:type polyketide synthase [Sphingomonas bacterium]
MTHRIACLNAVATAVPDHDIHRAFIAWAEPRIADARERALFRRMTERSGIAQRWSVLPPGPDGGSPVSAGGFYATDPLPPTSARMALYAREAPRLALAAIDGLGEIGAISHLVVASCTGFVAPGIDQIIAAALGLGGAVERTLIGFMGCYAAVAALRTARHIVRSTPDARVLVVTVELSTLHLQPDNALEPLLSMLQFGDGAAAAIVSAEPVGFALDRFFCATLPESDALIRWTIGDQGFAMHLSGEVPGRIGQALADPDFAATLRGEPPGDPIDAWAVHAGGRSILDAVEHGLGLAPDALAESREVLARHGNMSSSTLMFVLAALLERHDVRNGIAMAFGPGLAAEGFNFRAVG